MMEGHVFNFSVKVGVVSEGEFDPDEFANEIIYDFISGHTNAKVVETEITHYEHRGPGDANMSGPFEDIPEYDPHASLDKALGMLQAYVEGKGKYPYLMEEAKELLTANGIRVKE